MRQKHTSNDSSSQDWQIADDMGLCAKTNKQTSRDRANTHEGIERLLLIDARDRVSKWRRVVK